MTLFAESSFELLSQLMSLSYSEPSHRSNEVRFYITLSKEGRIKLDFEYFPSFETIKFPKKH